MPTGPVLSRHHWFPAPELPAWHGTVIQICTCYIKAIDKSINGRMRKKRIGGACRQSSSVDAAPLSLPSPRATILRTPCAATALHRPTAMLYICRFVYVCAVEGCRAPRGMPETRAVKEKARAAGGRTSPRISNSRRNPCIFTQCMLLIFFTKPLPKKKTGKEENGESSRKKIKNKKSRISRKTRTKFIISQALPELVFHRLSNLSPW